MANKILSWWWLILLVYAIGALVASWFLRETGDSGGGLFTGLLVHVLVRGFFYLGFALLLLFLITHTIGAVRIGGIVILAILVYLLEKVIYFNSVGGSFYWLATFKLTEFFDWLSKFR